MSALQYFQEFRLHVFVFLLPNQSGTTITIRPIKSEPFSHILFNRFLYETAFLKVVSHSHIFFSKFIIIRTGKSMIFCDNWH